MCRAPPTIQPVPEHEQSCKPELNPDPPADPQDKDAPLKEDIRLLGRLLGDVLRNQEGEAVFDVVETIRQTAVRFRREDDPRPASSSPPC
jgi:hypothetical protein